MHFHQDPTNIVAKGGSSAELSRWRDQYVDPEDLSGPTAVVFARNAEADRRRAQLEAASHPIGALVALHAAQQAEQSGGPHA